MTNAKLQPVCCECGSADIITDAYLEWDMVGQKWATSNAFRYAGFCNHCDQSCQIKMQKYGWSYVLQDNPADKVTPEMILAGICALSDFAPEAPKNQVVQAVFDAMRESQRQVNC